MATVLICTNNLKITYNRSTLILQRKIPLNWLYGPPNETKKLAVNCIYMK